MDTYEVIATALKQIIDTEFAAEGITAVHDNLHESLGLRRVSVGIAPVRDAPNDTRSVAGNFTVEIRFYDLWDKKVDPEQSVNPIKITGYAERLKKSIQQSQIDYPGTGEVWFFQWVGTEYPDDPTGNKTRFHMTVRSWGNNTALVETSG